MWDEFQERVRRAVSKFVMERLDWLPRFPSGPIGKLQRVRRFQRRQAKHLNKESQAPENSSAKLMQLEFVFLYEIEDFAHVHRRLKRVLGVSKSIRRDLQRIIDREHRLDGVGWTNLGTLLPKATKNFFPFFDRVVRLASWWGGIDRVNVCHYRVLPSLAALHFSVPAPSHLVDVISREASKFRYPEIVTTSLWPPRFFEGYSMEGKTDAREAVSKKISQFSEGFERWICREFGIRNKSFKACSTIGVYKISRSDRKIEFGEFCKEERAWLGKMGYGQEDGFNYKSELGVFSFEKNLSVERRSEVFFFEELLEDSSGKEGREFSRNEALSSMVLHSGVIARTAKCRADFEVLRAKALVYLRNYRRRLHKSAGISAKIRLSAQVAARIESEIKGTRSWSFLAADGAAGFQSFRFSEVCKYSDDARAFIDYNLKQVRNAAKMILPVVSDQMNADNISVMYQLQSRVFYLTIVSVLVAIVGLAGIWDKIGGVGTWVKNLLDWLH